MTWSSALESVWATCWDLVSSGESSDVNAFSPHRSCGDYGVIWLRVKWKGTQQREGKKKKKLSKVVFRFEGDKMSFVALLSLSHARVPQMCLEEFGPWLQSLNSHGNLSWPCQLWEQRLRQCRDPSWALRALLIDLWHPAQLLGWTCDLFHSSKVCLHVLALYNAALHLEIREAKSPAL